jgi:hypothetical protein
MVLMRLRKVLTVSGNSYAVRISKKEAHALGIRKGDEVEVDIVPAQPGLRINEEMFFTDGRGSIDHDQEIGDAVTMGG